MIQPADIIDQFDEQAEEFGGTLALGDRSPVLCIVPDGVEIEPTGDHRSEASAVVIVRRDQIGTAPSRFEPGKLSWGGESYEMAVSSETIGVNHGTYTFTMAG